MPGRGSGVEVEGHMAPDTPFRLQELERRMNRVEDATQHIPVIQHDIGDIKDDVAELRDDTRSLRRALYTVALSVMGGAVIFAFSAFELFK